MKIHITVIALAVYLCSCTRAGSVKKDSAIGRGGRAVAVDIFRGNPDNVWAATPDGGLFSSGIGGSAWGQNYALPEFNCFDVKMFPLDRNTIFASCIRDTKVVNGGGIWLSSDGGKSWGQPNGSVLKDNSGKSLENSAYGIAFQFLREKSDQANVVVGTDYGLTISHYQGGAWTSWGYINPQPTGEPNRIYSVLALPNGRVLTFGDHGLWMSDNNFAGWYQDNNKLSYSSSSYFPHLLAASPISSDHIFVTTGNNPNSLYYSINGGKDWRPIPFDAVSLGGYYGSRGAFVKTVPTLSRPNGMDLYFGNAGQIFKKTLGWNGGDYDLSQPWQRLTINHSDNADMAISADQKTLYAANDGGIEKSVDYGLSWTYVGTTDNGFDALQIYDGMIVLSPINYQQNDLYFGTQDNYLYGSTDNGKTWPHFAAPEGGAFSGPVTQFNGYVIYYWLNQGDSRSGQVFNNPPGAYLNPNFNPQTAMYYVRDKTFMTIGESGGGRGIPGKLGLYQSSNDGNVDYGTSPVPIVNVQQLPMDRIRLSGLSSNPSVIMPFRNGPDLGLVRIDNAFDGIPSNETITPIPLPPGCQMGVYGAGYINDLVSYGVDPNDPNFLIVPNVADGQVWMTTDGGNMWTQRTDVTTAVTQKGKYLFSLNSHDRIRMDEYNVQTTIITFDPNNSKRVLIGTTQAGAVYSADHGSTWINVPRSESIPNITSFCFNQVISGECTTFSWGRGLWTLSLDFTTVSNGGIILFPRAMAQGKNIHFNTVHGDKGKAKQVYDDTSSARIYFKDPTNSKLSSNIANAGQKLAIVGKKWFSKLNSASFAAYLDNKLVERVNIDIDENGDFLAEIKGTFFPGHHDLKILQLSRKNEKKEIVRKLTIMPGIPEDR